MICGPGTEILQNWLKIGRIIRQAIGKKRIYSGNRGDHVSIRIVESNWNWTFIKDFDSKSKLRSVSFSFDFFPQIVLKSLVLSDFNKKIIF